MMEWRTKTSETFTAKINIAGDYDCAITALREFSFSEGSCFSVNKCAYVYTGGMEDGVCVTIINYARFPRKFEDIVDQARRVGFFLSDRLYQKSFSIESQSGTEFFSRRGDV